jgi:cytidylate kinase
MKTNYVITIGRQLGSGGKQIGELLSKKLGIPCYDKELILLASRESGLGKEFFEKFDEKSSYSFFSNIFGHTSGYTNEQAGNYLCNETLFRIQSDVIKKLAEEESCIFVGRCADYILRNHPHLFSIFVHAHIDDRIRRIIAEKNCTEKDARNRLEQTDKKRAEYYNYYSNKQWGLSTSYDLCINSSNLGIEKTTNFIFQYASLIL